MNIAQKLREFLGIVCYTPYHKFGKQQNHTKKGPGRIHKDGKD